VRRVGAGVEELAIADSAGTADPLRIERLVARVREVAGQVPLVLHLHDTRGLGLANLMAALRQGVTRFDTAFGGLGGCPFIPGATGNVATEDVAHLLNAMGVTTGVDVGAVCRVSARAKELLIEPLPSRMFALWEKGAQADGRAAAPATAPASTPAADPEKEPR